MSLKEIEKEQDRKMIYLAVVVLFLATATYFLVRFIYFWWLLLFDISLSLILAFHWELDKTPLQIQREVGKGERLCPECY